LAQVPQIISYQGSLAAYGTNANGTFQFKFAFVNGNGSQTYWSHDGSSSGGSMPVTALALGVTNGLLNVILGDTTVPHMTSPIPPTVFTNLDVRLRIWCSDGTSSFHQLVPDQPVASVGYAMHAASAVSALSLAPGALTNVGTVTQINTGPGLTGGPITTSGTLSIPGGAISNAMLQHSSITVAAGSGLSGGGTVALGGSTNLAVNLNRDSTLIGNGGLALLGLNLSNANTWTATQTFSSTINGSISGLASGFTGSLGGDVTGTQGATVITNLSVSKIAGLLKWQTASGTSVQAAPNTGYIVTNPALVILTLPTSAAVGDTLRISAPGSGGWRIAQNANQTILAGNFDSLQVGSSWIGRGPSETWAALASSADGSQLVGVVKGGSIFVSPDAGATWPPPRGPSTNWSSVASSAAGTRLVATVTDGFIYTSADSGLTWSNHASAQKWVGVASSSDGSKLAAAVNGGSIYTSPDAGVTWTPHSSGASWACIASSSDGTRLAAGANSGSIYFSPDSGVTWTASAGPAGTWSAIASSANGSKLVAAALGGPIYTSSNSGTNWTAAPKLSNQNWTSVASSADGTRLVAVFNSNGGGIYTSADSGASWIDRKKTGNWQAVVSSADGAVLSAAVNNGQIFVAVPPLVSSSTTTTIGPNGYLTGGQGTAVELQYIGNNQFIPLSSLGRVQAY
jgi:hypothetical protein